MRFSPSDIFLPRYGLVVFTVPTFLAYVLVPLVIADTHPAGRSLYLLAAICSIGILSMIAGYLLNLTDRQLSKGASRLNIPGNLFISIIFVLFLAFLFITFVTAPSIPLVSSLSGASADELSQERGDFLKGRDGAEIALLYASTILTSSLVPYAIVLLFASQSRLRYIAAALFFLFCISFLQKALFLNLILPLIVFFAITGRLTNSAIFLIGTFSFLMLLAASLLASGDTGLGGNLTSGHYFSSTYTPTGPLDYLVWRAFSVPVFTASDALTVHADWLNNDLLLGSTSSLLASIFGLERLNFERLVFQYQFGSWNEIANANSFYLVDSYVNFGWVGVVVFGLAVGQLFRWFRTSSDLGFSCLWLLFAFVLFSSPLIGMLLSNGFLYMIFHALFVRVR